MDGRQASRFHCRDTELCTALRLSTCALTICPRSLPLCSLRMDQAGDADIVCHRSCRQSCHFLLASAACKEAQVLCRHELMQLELSYSAQLAFFLHLRKTEGFSGPARAKNFEDISTGSQQHAYVYSRRHRNQIAGRETRTSFAVAPEANEHHGRLSDLATFNLRVLLRRRAWCFRARLS